MPRILLRLLAVVFLLGGCATSGYQQFYQQYVDVKSLSDLEVLQPGEEPKIYGTDNFDRDIATLRAKRYIMIGSSSFNGGYEDTKNAVVQAKRIGATIVLTNAQYTNTQTSTASLFLPNNQTTYHSGTVYGGGMLGGYSGTSTTYGSTVVPYTVNQRRYDQNAVYLVKTNQKMRFGIGVADLTPEKRTELGRNTGALIDVVIEDTPAFNSNVLAGDILISIDGNNVTNAEHALKLLNEVNETALTSVFTVIRNGKEQQITVKL